MSVARRAALASLLPIAAAPGLASAAPASADPALAAYRDVMSRKAAMERAAHQDWACVERWCTDESAAIEALIEQSPGGLPAFLRRLIIFAERMEDGTSWSGLDVEADLLHSLAQQARAMLGEAGGAA